MKYQVLAILLMIFFWGTIMVPLKGAGDINGSAAMDNNRFRYHQEEWTSREGLPGDTIYQVTQSRDGYLWLATSSGLVRFDGVRFCLCDSGVYEVLQGEAVFAILEDRHGTLWVGTTGRAALFKHNECVVQTYEGLGESRIRCIQEDKLGNTWLGTEGAGVFCQNRDSGVTTRYHEGSGLSNNTVRVIHVDRGGITWAGTLQGLNAIANGTIRTYRKTDGLPSGEIRAIAESPEGNLLIATSKGLAIRQTGTPAFAALPLPRDYAGKEINAIFADPGGALWLGVLEMGVLVYEKGRFGTPLQDDALTRSMLYSIFKDREGNTWFGSVGSGLKKISPYCLSTFNSSDDQANSMVFQVFEDSKNRLWFGTSDGLIRWDGIKKRVFTQLDGLSGNGVYAVCEDRSNGYWIGTIEAGLSHYNEKENRFTRYPRTAPAGPLGDSVYALHIDASGILWVGTGKALNRFNESDGTFTAFTKANGMSDDFVRCIVHDKQGNLWTGTDAGGLNLLKNGTFQVLDRERGLSSNRVLALYMDQDNVLWAGTYKGLNRLENGTVTAYTRKEGLYHDLISVILEDDAGYLWLGGDKGLFRAAKSDFNDIAGGKKEKITYTAYDERDGMESRVCLGGNQPSAWKTGDGKLWFPTLKGAVIVDPDVLEGQSPYPAVVLEEMIVDGLPRGEIDFSATQKTVSPLEFGPGVKRVEFVYTAPSFTNPEKILFKFRLEGYDKDWIEAGNKRSTYYTGLPHGQYRFLVTACNRSGTWNPNGAAFAFELKPYFYQTAWFYISVIVIVLFSILAAYQLRIRQLKAREKELSETVAERTQQLAAQSEKLKEMDKIKSRFFANISHEFRTPLTLIMGPLQQKITGTAPQPERQEAAMMLRSAQSLLNLINQLLDLSKLESGRMHLRAARQDIVPFLKGLTYSFESLAQQKQIELDFRSDEESILVYFDTEKMEKIFVNLLANAMKFTPAAGKVLVTVSRRETGNQQGYLEIMVSDTGIGIAGDQLAYIFDRFYQAGGKEEYRRKGTGIGLALAKELVELHHGDIAVYSKEGEGSEFTIRLPLGKDHLEADEISQPGANGTQPSTRSFSEPAAAVIAGLEEEASGEAGAAGDGELSATTVEDANETGEPGKDVILVVEDNPDVRKYISRPLSQHYTVVEVVNGKQGMERARQIIPDLIVSDVMMPEADGYELCRELKKDVKTSHIPIILLTAKASDESQIEGLETGADDYIIKPFNIQILLTRIKNLIDIRRTLQEKIQREVVLNPGEIAVSTVDREFMEELKKALEKNIAEPEFGVDDLAGALYMSRASLNRKIRALTGESTNQFIQSFRLKRGAQLLRANYGNVTEVAFAVGFSSSPYFTKCFKEKFDRLPHEYREMATGDDTAAAGETIENTRG